MTDREKTLATEDAWIAEDTAVATEDVQATVAARPDPNELVTVYLHKDSGKYKDDVFVGINGHSWLVQRGVEVQVPRYVAEVIQNSNRQRMEADRVIEEQSSASRRASVALNLSE